MTSLSTLSAARTLLDHEPLPFNVLMRVGSLFDLTNAEMRVLGFLADGYELIEIAHLMQRTEGSVRTYTKRLYSKTFTHNQAQLVRLAYRTQLTLVI